MSAGSWAVHPYPSAARRAGLVIALGAAMALGACSSATPPRMHSLTPAPAPAATASGGHVVGAGPIAWELLPVSVPPGVDQPQWVVRAVDGSYVVLEQERWLAPLGEELRSALVTQLSQTIGAPALSAPNTWRIRVDVQRFEMVPGREARLEGSWSIAEDGKAATLRCRGEFVELAVAEGYRALGAAHQAAVARLGEAISVGVKALAAGRATGCAG